MSDPAHDDLHGELRRHAASLRGLARDLLRDGHAAEDAAQAALAHAWSSREQLRPGPLGGWLARTLVHVTRQWRRGEQRRSRHHGEFARQQPTPTQAASPADLLARRETLQAVTTAVLALDEPYASTVMMRYFEDLPPRAIARRTGVNVATVKSRLARGLAMLRHRLAHHDDGSPRAWRPALAGLVGIPFGATLVPLSAGLLLVKTSVKASLAAAVLCVGGLFLYYQGAREPAPPSPQDAAPSIGEAAKPSTAEPDPAHGDGERTAVAEQQLDPALLAHPYELLLDILVVDTTGLPVQGHRPRLSPPGGVLRDAPDATDEHGRVTVRLPSRTPQADVELLDPRRHRRLVQLRAGLPTAVTLLQAAQGPELVFGAFVASYDAAKPAGRVLSRATNSNRLQPGLHPGAVFSEGGLVAPDPTEPAQQSAAISFDAFDAGSTYRLSGGEIRTLGDLTLRGGITFTPSGGNEQPGGLRVEGIVYGEDGKPAKEVPVALLGTGPQPLERTTTDAEGRFAFDGLTANTVVVRAGGTDQGLATTELRIEQGSYHTTLQLRRESCVRGVLRDPKGEPIGGATVEWQAADGRWADEAKTATDGTFLFANLPGGPGRLIAWAPEAEGRLPIAIEPNVTADSEGVELRGDPVGGGALQLLPQLPAGLDFDGLQMRVRQTSTGFSRHVERPRVTVEVVDGKGRKRMRPQDAPDRPWRLEQLPAGEYEVELWRPGTGHVSLGRHWVPADGTVDLGIAALPEPGAVRFEVPEGALPDGLCVEITSLRRTFDVRLERIDQLDHQLLLAPGAYVFSWRIGEQPVHTTPFTVENGRTATLRASW